MTSRSCRRGLCCLRAGGEDHGRSPGLMPTFELTPSMPTPANRRLFNITSETPGGDEGDAAGAAAGNRPQEGERADQKTTAGLLHIWRCNLARPRPRERLNHYHLIFAWRGSPLRNYSLQSTELISSQRLPGARPDHIALFLLACILIKRLPQPPHGQRPLCPDAL